MPQRHRPVHTTMAAIISIPPDLIPPGLIAPGIFPAAAIRLLTTAGMSQDCRASCTLDAAWHFLVGGPPGCAVEAGGPSLRVLLAQAAQLGLPQVTQSFGAEAEVLASVNHPNVLRFYGVVTQSDDDPSVIGIMTEYVKGGSLADLIRCAAHVTSPAQLLAWQQVYVGRCSIPTFDHKMAAREEQAHGHLQCCSRRRAASVAVAAAHAGTRCGVVSTCRCGTAPR